MKLFARWLGIFVQAMVLGYLLFFAILRLMALSEGAKLFRYQGF